MADKNVCNFEPKLDTIFSYTIFWLQIEKNWDAYKKRLGLFMRVVFKLIGKSLNISSNYFSVLSFLF